MRKSYKFKLQNQSNTIKIGNMIDDMWEIHVHILLLSRRYYRIYGSNLSASRLNKHITKLKKTTKRHWADLPNQVAQDVVLRYGKSQDAFSQKIKSRHKYSSLTFTEAGYTLEDNHIKINCIDTFRLWVP